MEFTKDVINSVTFDELLHMLPEKKGDKIEVNLQKVNFIDPYGMVCLWCIARYLKNMCDEVTFLPPEDINVLNYLRRMDFYSVISPYIKLESGESLISTEIHREDSEILLELTPIEKKEDIEKIVEKVLGRIAQILRVELDYQEIDINAFLNTIAELCSNIRDHSEDKGMIAVQRYTERHGKKYIIIGVADLGIGIKASLGKRYDVSDWNHVQTIVNALKKEYSRVPTRGLGLHMVKKIVGEYNGSLQIRSGDARLYLRNKVNVFPTPIFPGTQIYISLSQRRG